MRSRIEALGRELERKEETRREARDALRDSERAISQANRALKGLEAEIGDVRAEAGDIAAQRRRLERTLKERQQAVAKMLLARHAAGGDA